MNKFQLTMLASVIALTLSGCSTDDSEDTTPNIPVGNSVPTLNITNGNSVTIDERESFEIKYNVLDADVGDTHTVTYEVVGAVEDELKGSFSLDTSNKTLTYSSVNIQEEEIFSVLLNVVDSANNEASEESSTSRTVSVSIKNAFNEAPELSFSGLDTNEDNEIELILSPSDEDGMHLLVIPYEAIDEDDDTLELSLSGLSNMAGSVVLNEKNSTIEIEIAEVYEAIQEGVFTFSAYDGVELATVSFKIVQNPTAVSPVLEINKTLDGSGDVIATEVPYGSTQHTITFNKSDKNGDIVFVTASLSEEVATFEENVSGNSLNLTNILVEEDTVLTVTLTATDNTGTENIVDTIELSIQACTDCAYILAEENRDLYLSQYGSISGRQDESTLLNFYTDYLVLTDQITNSQSVSYKQTLSNNYLRDKNSVEAKILQVNTEFVKVEENQDLIEDKEFVERLSVLVEEFKNLVLNYGESNIALLNTLSSIDGKLPKLLISQQISEASSVEYSKYVGNGSYGYLLNSFEWVFLTEYEVLEVINVLSAQCK